MGRRRSVSIWPNVSHFKDRHGHTRWRYRRQGFKTVILHGVMLREGCGGDRRRTWRDLRQRELDSLWRPPYRYRRSAIFYPIPRAV